LDSPVDESPSSGVRLARRAPAGLRADGGDMPPQLGEPRSELRHVHPGRDHLRVEVLAQKEDAPRRSGRVSIEVGHPTLTFVSTLA
ncbi:MAG: hypothetical protein ACREX3_23740, partial [Gammaproteobacteria bacterium]